MTEIFKPTLPIQWNWVTLSGPDAKDFLHRLTTVHVKDLSVGQGQLGCFLNPQGKIRVLFTLWNCKLDEYAFELDAGQSGKWKSNLLDLIDQYTFGEKIKVTDLSHTIDSIWLFPEKDDLPKTQLNTLKPGETLLIEKEGIRLCHQGFLKDPYRPWITVWGEPTVLSQWLEQSFPNFQQMDFSTLEAWRLKSLLPRVDAEITENRIPLEVGLRNTISDNKGCYPGQEVIEKIISLGSPPKRLAKIEGIGVPPQPGSLIYNLADPPIEVGSVTSSLNLEEEFIALGLIKKIHAKEGLEVRFSEKENSKGVISQVTS